MITSTIMTMDISLTIILVLSIIMVMIISIIMIIIVSILFRGVPLIVVRIVIKKKPYWVKELCSLKGLSHQTRMPEDGMAG
jgi:hypothetical protein